MNIRIVRFALAAAVAGAVCLPPLVAQVEKPAATAPATEPATGPATAPAADANKVVVTIGDEKITAGEFEDFLTELPPQYQSMAHGPAKRLIAEDLVKLKLLAKEARKRKIDEEPKVKGQLNILQDQVLAAALAAAVEKPAQQQYYDQNRAEFEKVRARHILIRTPGSRVPLAPGKNEMTDAQAKAKADDIRARLAKGDDFAKIAQAESDDTGSGERGGELGTFARGQMVPEFDKAVFSLKKGEISEPIKTQFGYHIIQVEDIVSSTFDEARDDIRRKLGTADRTGAVDKLTAELRKADNPVLDDSYFGPPTTQPATPASESAPAGQ